MIDPFFDELPDGVCVSDLKGQILYMNPAAERLLDTSIAKALGRPMCELLCGHLATGGRKECASDCALRRGDSGTQSVTFVGKRGPNEIYQWMDFRVQHRQVWKNLRVRCMKTAPSFLGEGRRLTLIEDRSNEADFERHKEDWRHMIAHDLRAPLTNIYAVVRMLQDSMSGQSAPPDKKLVDISARACDKMDELLTLYLDVAKLDAGLMPVKIEPVSLAQLLAMAIEGQSPLALQRHIKISTSVPEDLAAVADPALFPRVIDNVLNNAVKYTPEGGAVSITARMDGAFALLSVKDTGTGISPEDLPSLFDRFYQSQIRRAGKIQGTGLGLTFCREALAAMNGSIEVYSELGKGTEFIISLPVGVKIKKTALSNAQEVA